MRVITSDKPQTPEIKAVVEHLETLETPEDLFKMLDELKMSDCAVWTVPTLSIEPEDITGKKYK